MGAGSLAISLWLLTHDPALLAERLVPVVQRRQAVWARVLMAGCLVLWFGISSGPYRYVRHPMYAAVVPFFAGAPLVLGSWYGLVLLPIMVPVLAVRCALEERMLIAGLDGYADYMKRVRYRLIPGVG